MSERVILVCDVCARPATGRVSLRVEDTAYVKDLCKVHLRSLLRGAQRQRPSRPRTGKAIGEQLRLRGLPDGPPDGPPDGAPEGAPDGAPEGDTMTTREAAAYLGVSPDYISRLVRSDQLRPLGGRRSYRGGPSYRFAKSDVDAFREAMSQRAAT